MQELLYTSVPRGLKPGSRGFSTVLSTQGMVAPLAAALEALSGYRPVFPIGHARVAENPVVYSHLKLQVAGKSWYVLSRVADYGLDYSQRTNKLAHHLVLDKSELPAAGPASLLRASGVMRELWEGEPKIVPPKPMSKQLSAPSGVCQAWKEMTGDAGWAGVLAESFLKDANRPVILLFEPGQDLRPLIDESLSLLPADRRWDVTFNTYFTGSSQGITCLWRGIVLGSKEATESLRFVNALRIDLTSTDIGRAEGGELVDAARKGIRLSARPTLPSKQTASREQQPQRVVVPDNVEEPTEPQAYYEPADTETHAAPVTYHDHSQAPPRLTPSVFKFANARSQADVEDPGVQTSLWQRFIIVILVVGSLSGVVLLGLKFAKKIPSNQHDAALEAAKKKADDEAVAKTKADDDAAKTMALEAAKKKADDEAVAKTKADDDAAKAMALEAAKKKADDEAVAKTKAVANQHRVELFDVFEGAPPKHKLKDNAIKTDIPSAELSEATLMLMSPFEKAKFDDKIQKVKLPLKTADVTESHLGTFSLEETDGTLSVKFDAIKPDAVAVKFLRFCVLRLKVKERTIDFSFCKSLQVPNSKLNDGITKFRSSELAEALEQQIAIDCHELTIKTNTKEQSLKVGRKGSSPFLESVFDKALCSQFLLENGKLFFQKGKAIDEFEIHLTCDPLQHGPDKTPLVKELVNKIQNGPKFVDDRKKEDTHKWDTLGGLFEEIERKYKAVREAHGKSKEDNDREAKFMDAIRSIKQRTTELQDKVNMASESATTLRSASVYGALSVVVRKNENQATVDVLHFAK